jgi:hypothetical protein
MKRMFLTACIAGVQSVALAAACPDAVPEGLSAVPVGNEVVTNGLSMAITQVHGKEKAATILARVEARWKQDGHDVRRTAAAGWDVVSAKGKGCLVTLQLADRDTAFGYLTRGKQVSTMLTAARMGVTLPRDATISSTVASKDDGRRGLVLALQSGQDIDALGSFFAEQLHEQNWKAVRAHRIHDKGRDTAMQFVSAQRGRQQVEIVIWREQKSQIVMTVSDAL